MLRSLSAALELHSAYIGSLESSFDTLNDKQERKQGATEPWPGAQRLYWVHMSGPVKGIEQCIEDPRGSVKQQQSSKQF